MKYRKLGSSDLMVSEIALGSWLTYSGGIEKERSFACIKRALDLGVTLIDTANIYGRGASETLLGEALSGIERGSYVLAEADGPRAATIIATGSEVSIAMEARAALAAEGHQIAVVSLPCWELFAQQDDAYRASVLGTAPRIGVEAAASFGWERWLGPDGIFIGMPGFGASAPAEVLYKEFGITADAIVAAVKKKLG